jgi:uncharacterized RDD family membrane protein YckC
MTSKQPPVFSVLWLALALALAPVLRAQEAPAAPPPPAPAVEEKKVAPAPATPAPEEKKPATAVASAEEKKPDETAPPAEETAAPDKSDKKLRELGTDDNPKTVKRRTVHHSNNNERVAFGQDSTLPAGQQADAVVSIIGSSTSAGEVADAVVSVIGNTRVTGGSVGDAAVAVLGSVYVNGHVHGDVVAVFGDVELGPDAVVDGQVVHIGGDFKRDDKAVVHGSVQNVALGGKLGHFEGLAAWFRECLLYARPLAFAPHLGWAWGVAFVFLAFYVFLALVAPDAVVRCAQTLEQRPGYSLLSAVLTLLLTPVVFILLALTLVVGIGFALIPLFAFGLFLAGLFGKVVMLAWLGRRLTKLMGDGPLAQPVFAVLIGGLIVLGLYTIPVFGFILYKAIGVLGLGVVVYTLILAAQSSRAAAAAKAAEAKAVAVAAAAAVPPLASEPAAAPAPAPLPPILSAATLPRAGFWRRIAATILDFIMVAIVFSMLQKIFRGFADILPLWFTVYCIVMWATKGTTIGGVICGLKLVRLDDRPIDWGVASVRALGGFLSLAAAGLGFIWVAFDDDKQSWHDKIAGTTIVVVPKGTALL